MYSLIEKLKSLGTLKIYHDYRSGTFRDWSGNGHHGTPANYVFQKDHLRAVGIYPRVDIAYDSSLLLPDGGSIVALPYETGAGATSDCYINLADAGGSSYFFAYIAGSINDIYFTNGATTDQTTTSVINEPGFPLDQCYGVTFAPGVQAKIYVDGQSVAVSGSLLPNPLYSAAGIIRIGGSRTLGTTCGALQAVLTTSTLLTDSEQAQICQELRTKLWLPSGMRSSSKRNVFVGSSSNLIGGWNSTVRRDSLIDQSDNIDVDLDLYEARSNSSLFGESIEFENTTGSYAEVPNTPDIDLSSGNLTVELWFKQLGAGSHNPSGLVSFYLTASDFLWLRQYTDGTFQIYTDESGVGDASLVVTTDAALTNSINHLVLVKSQTNFKIYLNGDKIEDVDHTFNHASGNYELEIGREQAGRSWNGEVFSPRIFSDLKDEQWISQQYLAGAKTVPFASDWGVTETTSNITAGPIPGTPIEVSTGTWKVVTEQIEGVDSKVLECVSTGICYIPLDKFGFSEEDMAFGTWDFWFNKVGAATSSRILFTADTIGSTTAVGQDGYAIVFSSTERIQLRESVAGVVSNLFYTDVDYFIIDTWYNYRVTRNYQGGFSVYLDGSLISVGGGGGTNPVTDLTVTTAPYLVFDLDTADKVSLGSIDGRYALIKYAGVVPPR